MMDIFLFTISLVKVFVNTENVVHDFLSLKKVEKALKKS